MRLLILVEGPTEQAFASRLLRRHLWESAGIEASAPCIETSRDKTRGQTFRGGHAGRYDLIRRHVQNLLKSDPRAHVTSLFDLYGLPPDFPGLKTGLSGTGFQRAEYLERMFAQDIGDPRFIPNLAVHEFEGLLFTSPEAIANLTAADLLPQLQEIAAAFASPEAINDSPQTAPSKRLEQIFPGYRKEKARLGPLIAEQIGLAAIRQKCAHFDAWLRRIEALGR